jgi:hypothetical protein
MFGLLLIGAFAGNPVNTDPPLSDLQRFPDAEVIQQALEFNEALGRYLEPLKIIPGRHGESAAFMDRQRERLWNAWDALRWARCGNCSDEFRRQQLGLLRHLLGEPAYVNGWMLPSVPWWLFPERD